MNGFAAVRRWFGEHLVLGLGILVLVYTFVPIVVVALMSFNDSSRSRNLYKFQEFTWSNWLHPWEPNGMKESVILSVWMTLPSMRSFGLPSSSALM